MLLDDEQQAALYYLQHLERAPTTGDIPVCIASFVLDFVLKFNQAEPILSEDVES